MHVSFSLENLCVYWIMCISYLRHHLHPYSLRLCNRGINVWVGGTSEVIQFQPPITQPEVLWRPLHSTAPKKAVSCWDQARSFGGQSTAENGRYGDHQKGCLQWIQLVNSRKPRLRSEIFLKFISWAEDMLVLQLSTSCYISFPTLKWVS